MPWERQPAWLYLPHLADAQPRVGEGDKGGNADVTMNGAEDAERKSEPGRGGGDVQKSDGSQMCTSHGRGRGCAGNLPAAIVSALPAQLMEYEGSGGSRGRVDAAGDPGGRADRADGIRGQRNLPGACDDSYGVTCPEGRTIRGQGRLPGAGSGSDGGLPSVDGEGEGITTSSETRGMPSGSRGRDKEVRRRQIALSSIQRSLEDHAERVADKRRRLGDMPPPPTPAERMAALKERIAAKRRGGLAEPNGAGACAAAAADEAHHGSGVNAPAGQLSV